MMSSYKHFADYYDLLMGAMDYTAYGRYLLALMERLVHPPGLTLDLACGTGNMTFVLSRLGVDVFGADRSVEMLTQAKDKAYALGQEDLLFLCQDMRYLDLYGTVDTVVSVLDSLNHLGGEEDLAQTMTGVFRFLNPGGLFIFDMNTIYKHREILGNQAFVLETPEVYCGWQNSYEEAGNRVEIRLDFFERGPKGQYRRSSECFSERAYPREQVESLLLAAGFRELYAYEAFGFAEPGETTERIVYAARKGGRVSSSENQSKRNDK